MVHACNPGMWEVETEGSGVQAQLQLNDKTESSLDGREPLETTAAAMTRNHNYKNCQPHWEASSVCAQACGCAVVHYLRQQKDSCQKGLLAFGRQQKRDTSFRVERMGGRKRFNPVVWKPQCEKNAISIVTSY